MPLALAEGSLCTCGCRPAKPRRFCECGCNREITHRRAGTYVFGATCRKRLERANARVARQQPLIDAKTARALIRRIDELHTLEGLMSGNGTYVPARRPVTHWADTQAAYRRRRLAGAQTQEALAA